MRYILDEMLPDAVVEEDTETQAEWRAEVMEVMTREDAVELRVEEVESAVRKAISKLKNRKAPGWDGVKAEALKCVGGRLAGTIAKL